VAALDRLSAKVDATTVEPDSLAEGTSLSTGGSVRCAVRRNADPSSERMTVDDENPAALRRLIPE